MRCIRAVNTKYEENNDIIRLIKAQIVLHPCQNLRGLNDGELEAAVRPTLGRDNLDRSKNSPKGLTVLNLSSFQLTNDILTASNTALPAVWLIDAEADGVVAGAAPG